MPPPADDERQRKREIAGSAMYLVVGIAMIGALLIAMVLLWGVHVRRQTRRAVRTTSPHDPLWYLKTQPKPPTQEPDGPPTNPGNVPPGGNTG